MATEVKLAQLGQTMEEGTVVNYMVKVGDEVKKGECLFEIETDKATLEVESPADGFVKHIVAGVGQTLAVGQTILVLGEKNEELPQSFIDSLKTAPAKETTAEAEQPADGITGRVLEEVVTTRESGLRAKLGATVPLGRLQKLTAERMLASKRRIPCFYLAVKADVTEIVELRAELNKSKDVKISYNDFIMRAVALGLEKFPFMTGQLAGDSIRLAESIDIGLAISVSDNVIVPVVRDVNKKDIISIAHDSQALIEKVRDNKLLLTELEGACITISNLGAIGVESFTPIVIPGQCSILGIGRITDTCLPDDDDTIIVRRLMTMTLCVDHRVTNGSYAARFLDFVRKLLEDASVFV